MPVKYKLGFTIDAQTLFGILSKFLPIENLSVEEVVERPAQAPLPHDWSPGGGKQIAKPKAKKKYTRATPSIPLNLKAGINRIIIALLEKQPTSAINMRAAVTAGGYSRGSVGSRLQRLEEHKIVARVGDGTWILTPEGKARVNT
jgi:hypothetical protein